MVAGNLGPIFWPMVHVGIGYDVHALVPGRKLILGGVEIPHSKGLEGHSDADALMHAICDAVLGAIAGPDIGHLSGRSKRWGVRRGPQGRRCTGSWRRLGLCWAVQWRDGYSTESVAHAARVRGRLPHATRKRVPGVRHDIMVLCLDGS